MIQVPTSTNGVVAARRSNDKVFWQALRNSVIRIAVTALLFSLMRGPTG